MLLVTINLGCLARFEYRYNLVLVLRYYFDLLGAFADVVEALVQVVILKIAAVHEADLLDKIVLPADFVVAVYLHSASGLVAAKFSLESYSKRPAKLATPLRFVPQISI